MKKHFPKIILIFLLGLLLPSCSVVKKVPDGNQLLTKNTIITNDSIIKNERIEALLNQKPNGKLFGYPLRLSLYNAAKENPDSLYYVWLNRKPNRRENLAKIISNKQVDRLSQSFLISGLSRFLKKTGEAPTIIDPIKTKSTRNKLKGYYNNKGYFDAKVESKIDSTGKKRAKITYQIITGEQSTLDSIDRRIETPLLDSLFVKIKSKSFLKKGAPFDGDKFDLERARLTNYFRNNGVYHFQINNIKYDVITNENDKTVDVIYDIEDRKIKQGDTLVKTPFKIYKISQVNIFTNNNSKQKNKVTDSINYKGYHLFSNGKLNYKPKAITDAVFIEKGNLFSDQERSLTSLSLSNLKVFNFPNIEYIEDPSNENSLIANIYLTPLKKKNLTASIDFTHSNIQNFGITGNLSLTFRNLFKRAETLEISARGNIGSSKDFANPNNTFFNIAEYGIDTKLSFPRIFFLVNTKGIIKKEMLPTTLINFGLSNQRNIGLDKENATGSINYNWTPRRNTNMRLDLINIQFIRNLNINNYFNVYNSSYRRLNDLAVIYNNNPANVEDNIIGNNLTLDGAVNFINEVVNQQTTLGPSDNEYQVIRSIGERRKRLIENNLIVSSAFTYNKNTRQNFKDEDFYNIKAKIESAGNITSLIAKQVKEPLSSNGNKTLFDVEYAQYIKGEFDLIKHWGFGKKRVLTFRTFAGIAIPYGNANSIPFSKSYFAGGSNDNRGWQAYSLGPGKSGGINDFNEANLKIAGSVEYRFNIAGQLNGALFADAGNIWNIFDNVTDKNYTFNGVESLKDLALGTGIGFRYDFEYFVFRMDLGFKTYNPAKEMDVRWFKDVRLDKAVLNFGINYPF